MVKARILIVEDERIAALYLAECLRDMGHEVVASVSSGEEAIRKAGEIDPDLILMDIRLPGTKDGIDVADWLHKDLRKPVIYMTAYSDEKTLERAKATEPYGYLLKPFEERSLKSAIEMALYKSAMDIKVQRNEEWFRLILEHMNEALIVTDIEAMIEFSNLKAEKLTQYSSKEVQGKVLGQILKLSKATVDSPSLLPVTEVLLQGKSLNLTDYILLTKNDLKIPMDINLAPLRNKAGNIVGMVLIFHETMQRP